MNLDTISLPIETPAVNMAGLDALLAQLKLVEAYANAANAAINGVGSTQVRGLAAMSALFKDFSKDLTLPNMQKAMGYDAAGLAKLREFMVVAGKIKDSGFIQKSESFKSLPKAAAAAAAFEAANPRPRQVSVGELLTRTPTAGQMVQGVGGSMKLEGATGTGAIKLEGVVATGTIVLEGVVATGAVGGAGVPGPGNRDPATGQILPGGLGGGGGGGKKKAPPKVMTSAGGSVVGTVITSTPESITTVVESLGKNGLTLFETFNEANEVIKQVLRDPTFKNVKQRMSSSLAYAKNRAEAESKGGRTGDRATDLRAEAEIKQRLAKAIGDALSTAGKQLPPEAFAEIQEKYESIQKRLGGEAKGNINEAVRLEKAATKQLAADRKAAREQAAKESYGKDQAALREAIKKEAEDIKRAKVLTGDKRQAKLDAADLVDRAAQTKDAMAARKNLDPAISARARAEAETLRATRDRLLAEAGPAPAGPATGWRGFLASLGGGGDGRLFTKGLKGFTGSGFVQNMLTGGGWMLAITAVMKAVELVTHSLQEMINVGAQTARLGQVFRGVGGSAQQLTADVLDLAAANGRATDEAMESAIQWSRLGLTRTEVNEAVTASLMAANVAEISAAEATKSLSALYSVYGLRAGDLVAVLGMLNQSSNTYNVTNQDLLEGLSRTAIVAKQFGLSLAETQGIIGAAVSKTGQTGAMMGNALKTTLARLGKPENEEMLQDRYGIDVSGGGGKALQNLYVGFQKLNVEEQRNMAIRIAGATQYNRFLAFMASYEQGVKMAISSQQHLNSAEIENAKVLGSVKSQLEGVSAAWSELVVAVANAPNLLFGGDSFMEEMSKRLRNLKNELRILGLGTQGTANLLDSDTGRAAKLGLKLASPMALSDLVMDQVDKWLDPGKAKRTGLGREAFAAEQYGGAARDTAGLISTESQLLSLGKQQDQLERIKGLNEFLTDEETQRANAAIKGNDIMAARAVLAQAEARYTKESNLALQLATTKNAELIAQEEQELALLEKRAMLHGSPALTGQITALKNQIARDRERGSSYDADEEQADPGRRQLNLDRLEQQKSLLADIAKLHQQMPGDSAHAEVEKTTEAMKEQLAVLEAIDRRGFVDKRGRHDVDAETATRDQIRNLKAELSAAQDRSARAQLMDDRAIAFGRAATESRAAGTGESEGERLQRRKQFLEASLESMTGRAITGNEAARGLQFEVELTATKLKLQERIIEARGEEKQLIEEANREYNRSILFAAPGQMLRKLTSATLADKITSPGAFLAMSVEGRQDFDQLHGGDAGARLRRERRQLGPGQTVEETQAEATRGRAQEGLWRGLLPTPKTLTDAAVNAGTAALGAFTKVLQAGNPQLSTFFVHIENLNGSLAALAADVAARNPVVNKNRNVGVTGMHGF